MKECAITFTKDEIDIIDELFDKVALPRNKFKVGQSIDDKLRRAKREFGAVPTLQPVMNEAG